MSYIFGGNTGLTPEQAKRRRQMAHQMAFGGGTPRNLGQGIDALGGALAGVLMERAARASEKEGKAGAEKAWGALWGDGGVDPVAAALAGTPQQPMPDVTPKPVEQFDPATGAAIPPQTAAPQWETGGKAAVAAALARTGATPGSWTSPQNLPRVIAAESGGNPNAVSPKGATGVMQIMPDTARDPGYGIPDIFTVARSMGVNVPDMSDATLEALLRNPEVNREFGIHYMRGMEGLHGAGSPEALAAYNAGPGAVAAHGGVPPYAETQAYLQGIGPAHGGRAAPQGGAGAPQAPMAGQPTQMPAQGAQGPSLAALAQAAGNPWLSDGRKAVVQALLQQRLSGGAKAPSSVQEYQFARQNGFTGSYTDFLGKKRGPLVQVGGEGDPTAAANAKAYAAGTQKFLEKFGMTMGDVAATGGKYAQQLAQIDQLEGFLSKVKTGTLAAWTQIARENFNISLPGDSGPAQAAAAILNFLTPQQRPPGSGQMSDGDVKLFKASLPAMINTPEGNAEIIAVMRAVAEHNQRVAYIAAEYPTKGYQATASAIQAADRSLAEALRARREANPALYGKVETADEVRARIRAMQEGDDGG